MLDKFKANCAFYLLCYLSLLIPLCIALASIYVSSKGYFYIDDAIISNSLTASSILTGFVGVVCSLITAFYDSVALVKLRSLSVSKDFTYYDILMKFIKIALISGILFLGICLVLQFFLFEYAQSDKTRCIINGVWFFIISCQIVYFYNSVSAMFSLLSKKRKV